MSAANDANDWVAKVQNQSRLSFGFAVTEMAANDEHVVAISADTLDLIGFREMAASYPEPVKPPASSPPRSTMWWAA